MKKLLFLVPSYASFRRPIIKTFKKMGWDVVTFDYRKGDLSIRTLRFTPLFGGREKASEMIDKRIIKINEKLQPDLILVIKGESLGKSLLGELRKKHKNKIVNWFPEHMNLFSLAQDIVNGYDYFFCFEPAVFKKLQAKGHKNALYMPFAAEVREIQKPKKCFDVSFVGTYYPYREEILSYLNQFNLSIWGDSRWYKSKLKKYVKGGRISQTKMADVIKKTKVNINIHHKISPKEGANLRNFEVTGSGGFLLTDYVKAHEDLFKIGKEIVCYKSPKDMVTKTAYFLDHEEGRENIAKRGFLRAKKDHNYKKRIKQMLSIIYRK